MKYPILVDPHVQDGQTWWTGTPGIAGWHFETPWPSYPDVGGSGPTNAGAGGGPDALWSFAYTQDGLGVQKVVIDSPTAPWWDEAKTVNFACYGTPWNRCITSGSGSPKYGNLTPGAHQIRVTATSATGRVTPKTWTINVPY